MKRLLLVLLFATTSNLLRADDKELAALHKTMTGHFTSAEQAKEDKEFFEVHLRMVPIWVDRKGEYWLYVEQAMATALDKPYRQRVYKLSQKPDGSFSSAVYMLPGDATKYAGEWKKDKPLAELKPEDLKEKEGCAITMKKKENGSYAGGTEGKGCASDLRGASYTTSVVTITADTLTSWDRGFDKDDKQVWGAVKGAYIFKKKKD